MLGVGVVLVGMTFMVPIMAVLMIVIVLGGMILVFILVIIALGDVLMMNQHRLFRMIAGMYGVGLCKIGVMRAFFGFAGLEHFGCQRVMLGCFGQMLGGFLVMFLWHVDSLPLTPSG